MTFILPGQLVAHSLLPYSSSGCQVDQTNYIAEQVIRQTACQARSLYGNGISFNI